MHSLLEYLTPKELFKIGKDGLAYCDVAHCNYEVGFKFPSLLYQNHIRTVHERNEMPELVYMSVGGIDNGSVQVN
jgi:hypothetical protein